MQQTPQVFCPNCRGGNAPGATQCQWCGRPLAPSMPVQVSYPAQPKKRNLTLLIGGVSAGALILLCGLCAFIGVLGNLNNNRQGTVASAITAKPTSVRQEATNTAVILAALATTTVQVSPTLTAVPTTAPTASTNVPTDVPTIAPTDTSAPTPDLTQTVLVLGAQKTADALGTAETKKTDIALVAQGTASAVAEKKAAPTQTVLASELAYAATAQQWMSGYGTYSQDLSTQFSKLDRDSTLVLDDNWKLSVAIDLAAIETTDTNILNYKSPPKKFAKVHSELKLAATDLDSGCNLYASSIDNISGDQMTQATAKFRQATTHLTNADNMMKTLNP